MTELEVKLSADIKDLRSKLAQAEKSVNNFGTKVDKQATKAGKGFKTVGNASGQANTSLLEFNRVIQDAPFGIQGVGNNITQLAGNFGNLVRTTGGAGAALKAVGAAFLGPGGVIFAISAAVSLLTVFGDKLKISSSLTKELTESTKEFLTSARSEISTIESLIKVGSNINLSYKVRQEAIDRLNEKYPDYLGNLTQENIRSAETSKSVDNLTKSLINQAKIRGVQATIEKRINDRSGGLTQALLERQQAARAVEAEIANLSKSYKDFFRVEGGIPLGQQTAQAVAQLEKNLGGLTGPIGSRLNELLGVFNTANKDVKAVESDIRGSLAGLEDILNNFTIGGFANAADDLDNGVTVIGKKLKNGVAKIKNDFVNLRDIFGITSSAQKTLDGFKPDFSNFQVQFNKLGDIVGFALKDSVSKVKPQLSIIEQNLRNFNTNASAIINDGIAQTFAGIGQAIGESLVNGGNVLTNVGASLLGSVGSILTQLGTMAIGIGIGIKAIQASLATLNPVAAIGAGVALIALGSAFSAGARSLSQSSGSASIGGQGSGSTSINTFQGGGFSSGASGGRIVFEISGQKLIGVLNNTLIGNKRLGGSVTIG